MNIGIGLAITLANHVKKKNLYMNLVWCGSDHCPAPVLTSLPDCHYSVCDTYLGVCCDIFCQGVLHQVMTHKG